MKKYTLVVIATIISMLLMGAVPANKLYINYIKTSEELLWMLEEMCESNDLPWGDTVCETDAWSNYCEARENLGLDYLKHYSKRGE